MGEKPRTIRGLIKVELESLEDLALLASMMPVPFLNYSPKERCLFMLLLGLRGAGTIYYYRLDGEPKGRFLYVDKVTAKVSFGDRVSPEPTQVSIPILRIKEHNIEGL